MRLEFSGGQRKGTSFDELWPQDKQGRHGLRLFVSKFDFTVVMDPARWALFKAKQQERCRRSVLRQL